MTFGEMRMGMATQLSSDTLASMLAPAPGV